MISASEPHPLTGQPVGPKIDPTPAARPGAVVLQGRYGRIERLAPAHAESLWHAVQQADTLWTYIADSGPFASGQAFAAWISQRIAADDPFAYAILDRAGDCLGTTALMSIRPAMKVMEVGSIVYAPALQRTPLGTEAQYLLARYAFETLGYRRYEWKCDALNAPSRRAALRCGFIFEGIFRRHMVVNGRSRDTAWFAMVDTDWPARKAAFERWLAADNFDAQGRQRQSLAAPNGTPA